MSRRPVIAILALIMLSFASCSTSRKGGKKHKRPSKSGGKGCDCPGTHNHDSERDIIWDTTIPAA